MKAAIRSFPLERQKEQTIDVPYGADFLAISTAYGKIKLAYIIQKDNPEAKEGEAPLRELKRILIVNELEEFEYYPTQDTYLGSINGVHVFDITDRE